MPLIPVRTVPDVQGAINADRNHAAWSTMHTKGISFLNRDIEAKHAAFIVREKAAVRDRLAERWGQPRAQWMLQRHHPDAYGGGIVDDIGEAVVANIPTDDVRAVADDALAAIGGGRLTDAEWQYLLKPTRENALRLAREQRLYPFSKDAPRVQEELVDLAKRYGRTIARKMMVGEPLTADEESYQYDIIRAATELGSLETASKLPPYYDPDESPEHLQRQVYDDREHDVESGQRVTLEFAETSPANAALLSVSFHVMPVNNNSPTEVLVRPDMHLTFVPRTTCEVAAVATYRDNTTDASRPVRITVRGACRRCGERIVLGVDDVSGWGCQWRVPLRPEHLPTHLTETDFALRGQLKHLRPDDERELIQAADAIVAPLTRNKVRIRWYVIARMLNSVLMNYAHEERHVAQMLAASAARIQRQIGVSTDRDGAFHVDPHLDGCSLPNPPNDIEGWNDYRRQMTDAIRGHAGTITYQGRHSASSIAPDLLADSTNGEATIVAGTQHMLRLQEEFRGTVDVRIQGSKIVEHDALLLADRILGGRV